MVASEVAGRRLSSRRWWWQTRGTRRSRGSATGSSSPKAAAAAVGLRFPAPAAACAVGHASEVTTVISCSRCGALFSPSLSLICTFLVRLAVRSSVPRAPWPSPRLRRGAGPPGLLGLAWLARVPFCSRRCRHRGEPRAPQHHRARLPHQTGLAPRVCADGRRRLCAPRVSSGTLTRPRAVLDLRSRAHLHPRTRYSTIAASRLAPLVDAFMP